MEREIPLEMFILVQDRDRNQALLFPICVSSVICTSPTPVFAQCQQAITAPLFKICASYMKLTLWNVKL